MFGLNGCPHPRKWAKCHKEARRRKCLRHRDFIRARMGSHIEPQRSSSCRQAFPQVRVLSPLILSVPCPRFRCVVQADGSSKGPSQMKVIDLREVLAKNSVIFPILEREYCVGNLDIRFDKKARFRPFPPDAQGIQLVCHARAATWSVASRVTAKRSRSRSHSRTLRSRQSREPNSTTIVPFAQRRPKWRPLCDRCIRWP